MITYNHQRFIGEAIEGVVKQKTNFPIDLVIGEDCSTDNTRTILLAYKEKYPQLIKLILHQKNIGMMKNFVQTLQACKGEYIALCDGDDYWNDASKLQKQVDFMEENKGYAITFHDCNVISANNETLKISKLGHSGRRDLTSAEIVSGTSMPTSCVLFRRKDIINLPEEFINVTNGDTFLFALIGQYGKAKFLFDIGNSAYRVHDGGVWSNKGKENQLLCSIETYRVLLGIVDSKFKINIKTVLYDLIISLAFFNKVLSIEYYKEILAGKFVPKESKVTNRLILYVNKLFGYPAAIKAKSLYHRII